METRIRRAEPADAGYLADTVADAFQFLAPSVFLVPDESHRRRVLTPYFRLLIELGLKRGEVLMMEDHSSVLVSVDVGPEGLSMLPDYDDRLREITGPYHPNFLEFDARLGAAHFQREHSWLALMATHPRYKGQRRGSRLLRQYLGGLEARMTLSYLEAANPGLVDFYARFTFLPSSDPISLPDGTEMYPMLWEPL